MIGCWTIPESVFVNTAALQYCGISVTDLDHVIQ